MKIIVSRDLLSAALTRVVKATDTKSTIPILGCVRISANDGIMILSATDLKISASTKLPCEILAAGEICVSASGLMAYVTRARDDVICLSVEDRRMTAASGRSRATFPTFDARDFPKLEFSKPDVEFSIIQSALSHILGTVLPFCSDDPARGAICGIYVSGSNVVATDVKCMIVRTLPLQNRKYETVLPAGICEIISSMKPASVTDDIKISVNQYTAKFETADSVYISRLIDGKFPDWPRVAAVAGIHKAPIVFDVEAMLEVCNAATAIVSQTGKQPRSVMLSKSGDQMHIHAGSPAGEEFDDEIACDGEFEPGQIFVDQMKNAMIALGSEGQAELHPSINNMPIRLNRLNDRDNFVIMAAVG
jgi:DNA polymerase-3 subunit beta